MKRVVAFAVAVAVLGIGISPTLAAVEPPKVPPILGPEGPDIRHSTLTQPKGVEGPEVR